MYKLMYPEGPALDMHYTDFESIVNVWETYASRADFELHVWPVESSHCFSNSTRLAFTEHSASGLSLNSWRFPDCDESNNAVFFTKIDFSMYVAMLLVGSIATFDVVMIEWSRAVPVSGKLSAVTWSWRVRLSIWNQREVNVRPSWKNRSPASCVSLDTRVQVWCCITIRSMPMWNNMP